MAVIKISEMTDATILQDEDYLPILQNNLNKKTKIELLRDYNKLHNKPILNGVTIENNKTIFDYNIVKENQGIQINEDKKTLELETLGSIEIENRADVNKAVTIKTADKTAKETAHQDMSKTYDPNGQIHLTEGENQPVSYKAVKKYVDTLESKVDANEQDIENKHAALESKVDENERDIENKYSALEEKVDTNESDIESKHTTLNNKVDENERDIEDKVQKLDEKTAAKDSELENLITTNEQDIEQKYTALNQKVEQNKQTTDNEIQQLKSKDSELKSLISANEEDIESKVQELDNKKLNREETPNTLPNPYALTFTGAVSGTYDGSAAKTINIPSVSGGGGSSYELPIASPTQLGGVQPVAKTDEMTQEVGVDESGGLFTTAGEESEKEYRLIRTIETVDGTSRYLITTDNDDNSFSLKEIIISSPAFISGSNYVGFGLNGIVNSSDSAIKIWFGTTTKKQIELRVKVLATDLVEYLSITDAERLRQSSIKNVNVLNGKNVIESIDIWASSGMTSGEIINIYGK